MTQFDDPNDPQVIGELLCAAGAQIFPRSRSTECCGARLWLSRSDAVQDLVGNLAGEVGADAFVTVYPLCHVIFGMI